jgi:hypothetical protein
LAEGDELIYEVRLVDRNVRPIRSPDGRFQNASGGVAATKSLMVASAGQTFEGVEVVIPAEELAIQPKDLPATAVFFVSTVDGQQLGRASARLPIARGDQLLPPVQPAEPDRRAYWFVRDPDRAHLPVLLGPYESVADALIQVPAAPTAPQAIFVGDYVWFVPVWRTPAGKEAEWIGPCTSETDIQQVARALTDKSAKLPRGFRTGPPAKLRLQTGLARRTSVHAEAPRPTSMPVTKPAGAGKPSRQ